MMFHIEQFLGHIIYQRKYLQVTAHRIIRKNLLKSLMKRIEAHYPALILIRSL